ncbi:MAG TPA: ankyrin repeat domain-containing protein [Trueperaceae bacterium]
MQHWYSLRLGLPPDPEVTLELVRRLSLALRLDEPRVLRLLQADTLILDDCEARALARVYRDLKLPLDIQKEGSAPPRPRPGPKRRPRPAALFGLAAGALLVAMGAFVKLEPAGSSFTLGTSLRAPHVLEARQVATPPPELFALAETGGPQQLQAALRAGADVDARDARGWTPLMIAAARNTREAVSVLLAAGADPNARDRRGQTPLLLAVRDNPDPAVMGLLIGAGADPGKAARGGPTLLAAARVRGGERVRLLEDYFLRASRSGSTDEIRAWLAAGMPTDLRDAYGQTPLMYAAQNSADAVRALLAAGADARAASNAGWTALMYGARENRDPAVLRLLLEAGADPEARNSDHRTAREIATLAGNDPALAVLGAAPPPSASATPPAAARPMKPAAPSAPARPAQRAQDQSSRLVILQCLRHWDRCGTGD